MCMCVCVYVCVCACVFIVCVYVINYVCMCDGKCGWPGVSLRTNSRRDQSIHSFVKQH